MKEMLNYNIFVYQTVVLFGVFAFMGWILETVYRSITNKRFINAGYLYGPFTPIYGAGGIIIMLAGIFLDSFSMPAQMLAFGILTTFLELIVGILIERVFGYRLWSYEENRLNYKGIICVRYAFVWALISWGFFYLIFPATYISISRVDHFYIKIAAVLLIFYLAGDFIFSTLSMLDFTRRIQQLYSEFAGLTSADMQNISSRFSRIFSAFPDLNLFMEKVIHDGVSVKLNVLLTKIAGPEKKAAKKKKDKAEKLQELESEYIEIVRDILENDEYQRLKNYYHHHSTIYEHLQYVSYLSYRMAKALHLDYRSAARGALLHDFFLYDWRTHDLPDLAKEKNHGLAHPRIALENARRQFDLNKVEEDIIVKHMWPMTPVPPKFPESFVVTFADKFSASREYTVRFKDYFTKKTGIHRS